MARLERKPGVSIPHPWPWSPASIFCPEEFPLMLWMASPRHCLSLLLLSTCVALLLQPPLGACGTLMEPVYPGDNATPEQMAQYAAELRRYGKRDQEDTLNFLEWGSPCGAAPRDRELSQTDV
ncbi:pancreatic polypeptide prohormone isoform 2-T2 [Glossophaga mutica]